MLTYGLKLWSNNVDLFPAARRALEQKRIDFVELYFNPKADLVASEYALLKGVPVTIHATHDVTFHESTFEGSKMALWHRITALADFYESSAIIVHPGRAHTFATFATQLREIDDPRIHIENMAGLSESEYPMFATKLDDLKKIRTLKSICFDLEKAVKASCYLQLDYKQYISECLEALAPSYFHISGGDPTTYIDEHKDLEGCGMDLKWMKDTLQKRDSEISLVFETPKKNGIENDLVNMEYFKSL